MLRFGRTPKAATARRQLFAGRLRFGAITVALLLVVAARARLEDPATQARLADAVGAKPSLVGPPAEAARLATVDFGAVRDNTFFRGAEQAAWSGVLGALAEPGVGPLGPALDVGYAELNSQPDAYRGALVRVRGVVRRVEAVAPAENSAGVELLHRVVMEPEGGGVWPITVYTLEPPAASDGDAASAVGWFFKNLSYRWAEGVGVTPVVLSTRLERDVGADRRVAAAPPGDDATDFAFRDGDEGSLGRALLAQLGVAEELDAVRDQRPLAAAERDAFYALLDAVAETPATQLVRLAQRGLAGYAARQRVGPDASRRERLVAAEVAKQAEDRRYSVAPLFGDGASQRGELLVVDVVVRRVVRIAVEDASAPVDHYYELDVFPEDSQNLPLVFCVRELPAGFPVGESVRQPARLAGFFFKQWAYRTRRPTASGGDRRQFAPLLVGRAPIALAAPAAPSRPGLAVGVAGVALLAATAVWLWRSGAAQRRYEATTLRRMRDRPDRDFTALG